jgi:hypothetical protein
VHCELGKNQYGKCDQKSSIGFDVAKKWNPDRPIEGVALQKREQQQRQPSDQYEDHGPTMH